MRSLELQSLQTPLPALAEVVVVVVVVSVVVLIPKYSKYQNAGTACTIPLPNGLRGSSVKLETTQRILTWPLRKDDTHNSRSVKSSHSLIWCSGLWRLISWLGVCCVIPRKHSGTHDSVLIRRQRGHPGVVLLLAIYHSANHQEGMQIELSQLETSPIRNEPNRKLAVCTAKSCKLAAPTQAQSLGFQSTCSK